jgi:hypothetical protein
MTAYGTTAESTAVLHPSGAFGYNGTIGVAPLVAWANLPQYGGTLPSNLYVRALISRTGFVRVYDPSLSGSVSGSSLVASNLPLVTGIIVHGQYDDAAPWYNQGSSADLAEEIPADVLNSTLLPQVGMVELFLTVPAVDTVNSASVQTFKSDASTIVILGH